VFQHTPPPQSFTLSLHDALPISEDLFHGLAPWLNRLPGRLLHVNVLGSAVFAAVSGSSAATCATIGKISLPELSKRGYDERAARSEEHTSELQSRENLVCRLLLE